MRILMQSVPRVILGNRGENGSVLNASPLFAMFMYGMLAIGRHALLDPTDRRMAAAPYTDLEARAHLEVRSVRMQTTGGSERRFACVSSSPADGQDWELQGRPSEEPPSADENAGRVTTREQRVL
jgi:hypothetical protein